MVVKLNESKLYLLVTGGGERRRVLLDENALDKVYVFEHAVVKLVLARCLLVGNSRLKKMTRAVKLVVVAVGKAVAGVDYRVVDVEISVLMHLFFVCIIKKLTACLRY